MTSTKQLLEEYGYAEHASPIGLFSYPRKRTTNWQRQDNGTWLRFDPVTTPVGSAVGVDNPAGGAAWGRATADPTWVQTPYRQLPKFDGVSGLHPATHPECFDWQWPDEQVAFIYAYHDPDGTQEWLKLDDGEGNVQMVRGRRQPDGSVVPA